MPVHQVPRHRAADKSQVQADLVRAPGHRMHLQQRVFGKGLQRAVLADRLAASARRGDRHQLALRVVAPDRRLDAPAGRGRLAIHQCQIKLLGLAQAELVLQPAVGLLILGQQDQARSLLIQPVYHSRPLLAAHPLDIRGMRQRGVHQRPAVMPRRRVHHHPGRLIDHDQVLIFENNR